MVRYIHLNPLRAGAVSDMDALDRYRWSGHGVLLVEHSLRGQVTEEILRRFSNRLPRAKQVYRQFVMDGVALGRRESVRWMGRRQLAPDTESVVGVQANPVSAGPRRPHKNVIPEGFCRESRR